ncbi:Hypothetical protein R9X50_00624900 [Acrodontium crateriforme]|uniref:Uncharacterized protein n=1 Tax=Acrodontium crateriforme TaxID=150365 RepID=A0AAQ3M8S8_9PEZI|nr:Hypothetical protein R9X50_00624900 [Acrodontium crateriforme]
MLSVLSLVNRLLPFATPGTPLVQDLLHLSALCLVLYCAPQIQEYVQKKQSAADSVNDTEYRNDIINENEGDEEEELDDEPDDQPEVEQDNVFAPEPENNEPEAVEHGPGIGEPGPVRPGPSVENQRHVGPKKARAIARRDQRRAYHEFQRAQGEAQRAQDAEGAAQREAILAAERERRKAAETALQAKKFRALESKREQERREREDEIRRRELTISIVREELEKRGMCDLFKVARQVGVDDEEWVEKILNASGIVGKKGDMMTMITGMGWAVRITKSMMAQVYEMAHQQGSSDKHYIEQEELGLLLESVLQRT